MKTALMINFTVDKENKKINVEREFAAPIDKVWAAWTESKLLDQWWAPKPWKTETQSQDFKVGGHWNYAMVGPDGSKHFCVVDYKTIDLQKSYSGLDAFTDENGNINESFPRSTWTVRFQAQGDTTIVHIETKYDKLEDLESIIQMGFKEGFLSAMTNLDIMFQS